MADLTTIHENTECRSTLLPVILSQPHGGLDLPQEVQHLLAIQHVDVYNDCDLWIDQLFDFAHPDLAAGLPSDAPLGVLATVSTPVARALVDANRLPDDLANPDGPVKSHTSYGAPIYRTPLEAHLQQALLERYWWDFHSRLDQALDHFGDQAMLLLDCHNMAQRGPSAYHDPGALRPLICIANMGDGQGKPRSAKNGVSCEPGLARAAAALAADIFGDMRLLSDSPEPVPTVAINSPFHGGYILARHIQRVEQAAQRGKTLPPALMIEVNRGLFVGDQAGDSSVAAPNLERIAELRQRLYLWTIAVLDLL